MGTRLVADPHPALQNLNLSRGDRRKAIGLQNARKFHRGRPPALVDELAGEWCLARKISDQAKLVSRVADWHGDRRAFAAGADGFDVEMLV